MFDFNQMIHAERSKRLQKLPKVTGTVLSAGCAGTWYFKWFTECTGHTGKHIGVELYSPVPHDLPPNVEWITNSVSDMRNVASGSVDLLFSGQNIEHISPDDMGKFLLEANRVLKYDGMLTIDSPNRSVTQHLGYAQPEHTLELTPDEAVSLVSTAGFTVEELYGIWLVIDPKTSKQLDYHEAKSGELSLEERTEGAQENVHCSFIWWLNARKRSIPSSEKVVSLANSIFASNYSGFVNARFRSAVGRRNWKWGTATIELLGYESGFASFGPYIPLAAGSYRAVFHIRPRIPVPVAASIVTDIASSGGTKIHSQRSLSSGDLTDNMGWNTIEVDFSLDAYTTGIEMRVFCSQFKGDIIPGATLLPL